METKRTLTVDEAAKILGISRCSAFQAVHRNEIPHLRIGRRILVPLAGLENLLNIYDPDRKISMPTEEHQPE